jgi:DNA-binding MarR family transcriptional regulator
MTPAQEMASACLAMRARRVARRVTQIYDRQLADSTLSAARMNVLVAVSAMPGVRATELGEALHLEKSTVSRDLARLLKDGHIEARSGHGRSRHLYATAQGDAELERMLPAWREAQAQARELLGELADLLARHG